jgi:hypothetical protein
MLRVYLDWNVFSRLDSNHEAFKKLTEILGDESKYLIPYSHAHILDLHRSYVKVGLDGIVGYLNKLQKYSNSLFVVHTMQNELEFQNLEAQEAMRQYIVATEEHIDFSFDLGSMMDSLEPFAPLMKTLFDFELPNPMNLSQENMSASDLRAMEKLRSAKGVERLFGTEETMKLGDFMQNIMSMSSTIMTDDSYVGMRDDFQKDIKVSGRLNDKRFKPIKTLDENAQKLQKKNFMELFESMLVGEDTKSLFNKIIAMCRQLDFHGFHQENIEESHHLDNVNTDYEHIAYASTCDIFIVKDKKAQAKAALAFELLGLNIRVTTPEEYVRFIENNQSVLETGENFIDYLRWLISQQPTVETEQTKFHFVLSFVLSYFNVICHQTDNNKFIIQKIDSPNSVGVFVAEINAVKDELKRLFGEPLQEFNKVGDDCYTVVWLTENLVLVQLKFNEGSLIVEVTQCEKMTRRQKIIQKIKSIWRSLVCFFKK